MGRLAPSHRRPSVHAFVPAWESGWHRSCLPFSPRGKFLLSPSVRTPGLLVIVPGQPLVLVFGIQLVGLFEHPAISVSVIGWIVGAAMNLARAVEYAVQTRRSRIVSFERLFPLPRFRATESSVDCRVFSVIAVIPSLMSVALWLAVTVADI